MANICSSPPLESSGNGSPVSFGPYLYVDLKGSRIMGDFGEQTSGVWCFAGSTEKCTGTYTSTTIFSVFVQLQFASPLRIRPVALVPTPAKQGPRSTSTPGGKPGPTQPQEPYISAPLLAPQKPAVKVYGRRKPQLASPNVWLRRPNLRVQPTGEEGSTSGFPSPAKYVGPMPIEVMSKVRSLVGTCPTDCILLIVDSTSNQARSGPSSPQPVNLSKDRAKRIKITQNPCISRYLQLLSSGRSPERTTIAHYRAILEADRASPSSIHRKYSRDPTLSGSRLGYIDLALHEFGISMDFNRKPFRTVGFRLVLKLVFGNDAIKPSLPEPNWPVGILTSQHDSYMLGMFGKFLTWISTGPGKMRLLMRSFNTKLTQHSSEASGKIRWLQPKHDHFKINVVARDSQGIIIAVMAKNLPRCSSGLHLARKCNLCLVEIETDSQHVVLKVLSTNENRPAIGDFIWAIRDSLEPMVADCLAIMVSHLLALKIWMQGALSSEWLDQE
ncbi:hypothetical protein M9H77_26198 [Catharanthus roseus]|uniref:Uncharacterized protein n=1 Tax=Catharanthus roseus TaxID=4058 RepID=A0ACC0AAI4_CATRO|nr:hypothetical protein M9H77_26198 [Catharanthus roseus]